MIVYHLLIEGKAYGRLGDERLEILPGDLLIFPRGDSHTVESGACRNAVNGEGELQRIFSQGLNSLEAAVGEMLRGFVCGYMVCERSLSQVFVAGLPAMFKVNIRQDNPGRWLENSIQYSIAEPKANGSGAEAVLARLCETLFIETLRRYMRLLPAGQTGWLAGARDAEVGRVLALMHQQPAASWTIATLAHEVGISRAVLAARFRQYLGEPPLAYLTRWRLQLGAQMLSSTSQSVSQTASKVGYDSEPAFNRAFKRSFGNPPARYRNETRPRSKRSKTAHG